MSQVDLPADWNVADIRWPILGDSFSWAGIEPTAAKKVVVIHATASQDPHEDGFTMAEYHVNNNGWDGIGVHFVVTKDSYPGRPGHTNPGAQVQYVGDLGTWRAGVANNNPGRIHIEISGLFTPGNGVPSEGQLRATRHLIDKMIEKNNVLPSINFYNQVDYHNHQATPGNGTACPGWQHPQFNEWFAYLQGGSEPSWFAKPAPEPAPAPAPEPAPTPVPVQIPVETVDNPATMSYADQEKFFEWLPDTSVPQKVVAVPSADVYDAVADKVLKQLPGGEPIAQIAGYFTAKGNRYYRTQWSTDKQKWNGILVSDTKDVEVVAPPVTPSPNVGGVIDGPQAPPVPVLDQPAFPDQEEPTVAPLEKPDFKEALVALLKPLLGLLLSPLRLAGLVNKLMRGNK